MDPIVCGQFHLGGLCWKVWAYVAGGAICWVEVLLWMFFLPWNFPGADSRNHGKASISEAVIVHEASRVSIVVTWNVGKDV